MFSNATEAQMWQERNCHKCWKYSPEATFSKDARCVTGFEIDRGYVTGRLSKRVERITLHTDCPSRQEKKPVSKKKDSGLMPLFQEVI